jgi:exodeoxyribonuclease V alpha subunit
MPDHLFVATPPAAVALEGSVDRITFYNPDTGFTVLRLRVRGRREPVAVVGTLPAVQPGEVLALAGGWQTDRVHGAQFRAQRAAVRPPAALDDVARYLGSGLITQLGPVLARRIVAAFGEQTLEVLDTRPERVREVPGIGPQRAAALAAAWREHRALRAVAAFLTEHGLGTRFAPRLVGVYGPEAPAVLRANPYRLVADVPGLGLAAADRLGRALGVRPTSPVRLQAAVQAALLGAADAGHTRLTREALASRAAALVVEPDAEGGAGGGDDSPRLAGLLDAAVTQLLAAGTVSAGDAPLPAAPAARGAPEPTAAALPLFAPLAGPEPGPGPAAGEALRAPRVRLYEPPPPPAPAAPAGGAGGLLGLSGLVRAEEALAARLLALATRPGPAPERARRWLAADREAQALSAEQRAAVGVAVGSGLFVLTGGPGVGKTTTLRVLVRCLRAAGRSVALCAPTGKAAKRLGEVVGGAGPGGPGGRADGRAAARDDPPAMTVHRLLGAGPAGFRHGERDPLPADVVVVDEASMLDTRLALAVAAAVRPGAQLVLVGDADQLPSVGPGQVLRDLLAAARVPAARLTTVFRQAARSRIVANAHRVRAGQPPELLPAGALGRESDCVFVPAPAAGVAAVATPWAARRLPQLLGVPPQEVQVLAPLTRVCQALNAELQAALNPPRGQAERPHGALALRAGDRVIQTRNHYGLGVFNGDTGTVTAVAPDEVVVDFGDGRVVPYAPADALDLEHAYCLTVHRAQGSEWAGVVLLASSAYGPMLSRNLLYTALTRARRAAVLIGDEAALARAVAETRDLERCTGLAALLGAGPPPGRGALPSVPAPDGGTRAKMATLGRGRGG